MKARIRYVLLLLFVFVFLYNSSWLNKLFFNKIQTNKNKFTISSFHNFFDETSFKKKITRSIKFKNYYEDTNIDNVNINTNYNVTIWKKINFKTNNQVNNHHYLNDFAKNCRLSNCFDFSKCKPGQLIKIHIYPDPNELINSGQIFISSTYKKILHIIRKSKYYEPDPKKACVFVTSFDTLDRDPLSIDFQKNLPNFIPVDNGKNHIIFNLYSGTWPSYHEMDFSNFNPGYAILVKASIKYQDFRPDFDIPLPLFTKNHPLRGESFPIKTQSTNYEQQTKSFSIRYMKPNTDQKFDKKNLLVFKGKRYIYGIGSETRNMLHHLDNKNDILIFTTCKHGKKWKELKDERCNIDNSEYDKIDYNSLMLNSTFCLVPRGRRLGSYRFLESLAAGCIPVVLSNDWVKPFDSEIDWNSIVIDSDERSFLNLPEILRSISWKKISKMRHASLNVYNKYFSSIEKIIFTTIKILEQRIQNQICLNSFLWNLMTPGSLWFNNDYSNNLLDYPFKKSYNQSIILYVKNGYTAIVHINLPTNPATVFHLLKNLSKSEFLAKVLLLWALPVSLPEAVQHNINLFSNKIKIEIIKPQLKNAEAKLYPYESIKTDCILSINPDSTLNYEELDFAFKVWLSFQHRIVGFIARDHYYDEAKSSWFYTSKWTNQYSIILLDGAFFHKYYSWLFTNYLFNNNLSKNYFFNYLNEKDNLLGAFNVDDINHSLKKNENIISSNICIDLILNFLVSHITREPPIKISQRKQSTKSSLLAFASSKGSFSESQICFQNLFNFTFNYLPLIKSQLRLDPLLFKDPVSTLRKKYLKMEQFI